jgi:hypothetical protein
MAATEGFLPAAYKQAFTVRLRSHDLDTDTNEKPNEIHQTQVRETTTKLETTIPNLPSCLTRARQIHRA